LLIILQLKYKKLYDRVHQLFIIIFQVKEWSHHHEEYHVKYHQELIIKSLNLILTASVIFQFIIISSFSLGIIQLTHELVSYQLHQILVDSIVAASTYTKKDQNHIKNITIFKEILANKFILFIFPIFIGFKN